MWGLLLIILPFVLILGYPYALHFDSVRLENPVIVFQSKWWRKSWVLFIAGGLAVGYLAITVRAVMATGSVIFASIILILLLLLARPLLRTISTVFQLHLSYWRHEETAMLTFLQPEQRGIYQNKGLQLSFLLTEVSGIVTYETPTVGTRGPLWDGYSYQVWTLAGGTEFIVTCLLSDFVKPDTLVLTGWRKKVLLPICWLPNAEQNLANLS